MQTTKLFTTMALSAALLAAVGGANEVMAAENTNSRGDSTAQVELTAGATDQPHTPVQPGAEGDGETTGNVGQLTLDYVPNFKFGSHKIDDNLTGLINTTTNANAQVTDYRGSGAGWKLQVALSNFSNGSETLKGVSLNIAGSAAAVVSGNESAAPNVTAIALAANGQPADLVTAGTDAGMGQWLAKFYNENTSQVTLTIPQGNKAGNYQADLIWRLTDAI